MQYFKLNSNLAYPIRQPLVAGIINLTSESFFKPSACLSESALQATLETMVSGGAQIVDIGAEPTSFAQYAAVRSEQGSFSVEQELKLVVPALRLARKVFPKLLISVDTSQPCVMEAAVNAGADIINDTRALQLPGALEAVAKLKVPVCLMHMRNMNANVLAVDETLTDEQVFVDVYAFLQKRIEACLQVGIEWERIIVDPGFGGGAFGKSPQQNFYLLRHLARFRELGRPILIGLSRKSMLASITGQTADRLLAASIAAAAWAVSQGAVDIIRVHDVDETVQMVRVFKEIMESELVDA